MTIRKRFLTPFTIHLALVAIALFAGSANAAMLTIDNPSFEDPALADGGVSTSATDWEELVSGSGVFNPPVAGYVDGDVPDLNQVAFLNASVGQYFRQTLPLGQTYAAGTDYILSVYVSPRTSGSLSNDLDLVLYSGIDESNEISRTTLDFSGKPLLTFEQRFATTTAAEILAASAVGLPIRIALEATAGNPGGADLDLDLVELESVAVAASTPEPSTFTLVGLALVSLGFFAWRRRW